MTTLLICIAVLLAINFIVIVNGARILMKSPYSADLYITNDNDDCYMMFRNELIDISKHQYITVKVGRVDLTKYEEEIIKTLNAK